MWRGLMLTKAVEQFLRDVRWGELDDLLIDMPPGTGDVQMGLARLLPRADMVIVTTPALAAQKVAQRAADMARRSFVRVVGVIENMTDFTCAHGGTYPLFGAGGGAALADGDRRAAARVRCRSRPAVSAGGDAGRPVALATGEDAGPAAQAFERDRRPARRRRAGHRRTEDGPDMAGCSARLLAAVEVALDAPVAPADALRSECSAHPSAEPMSRSDTRMRSNTRMDQRREA